MPIGGAATRRFKLIKPRITETVDEIATFSNIPKVFRHSSGVRNVKIGEV
jgi:hypothetical protein